MGVFHFFKIMRMVANSAEHHKYSVFSPYSRYLIKKIVFYIVSNNSYDLQKFLLTGR